MALFNKRIQLIEFYPVRISLPKDTGIILRQLENTELIILRLFLICLFVDLRLFSGSYQQITANFTSGGYCNKTCARNNTSLYSSLISFS